MLHNTQNKYFPNIAVTGVSYYTSNFPLLAENYEQR